MSTEDAKEISTILSSEDTEEASVCQQTEETEESQQVGEVKSQMIMAKVSERPRVTKGERQLYESPPSITSLDCELSQR